MQWEKRWETTAAIVFAAQILAGLVACSPTATSGDGHSLENAGTGGTAAMPEDAATAGKASESTDRPTEAGPENATCKVETYCNDTGGPYPGGSVGEPVCEVHWKSCKDEYVISCTSADAGDVSCLCKKNGVVKSSYSSPRCECTVEGTPTSVAQEHCGWTI